MPRSNAEKTREFQQKMRTQGAAGFAAGPWKDVEESLGMDQSVVVDQDGNPVWSVQHTRKPRHTVSRSAFDRLLGGVAIVALATLVTSVLAIYIEQTREPGDAGLAAGTDPAADTDTGNTITLLRPPMAGFIDRPAVEVREIPQDGTAATTGNRLPAIAGHGTGPAPLAETAGPASGQPDTVSGTGAMDAATASRPEQQVPDSSAATRKPATPMGALSSPGQDPVQAIETLTRQESPAAITGSTASTRMADETTAGTSPASAPATTGRTGTTGETPAATAPRATAPVGTGGSPGGRPIMAAPVMAAVDTSTSDDALVISDLAATDMASGTPQTAAAEETRAVSPAEVPATGTISLARREPSHPLPIGVADSSNPWNNESLAVDDVSPLPGATGRWIINLASYAGPKTARRMQQKFEALGVSTEKQVAEVNGTTMYRLRIASFESYGDAEAYFDTIKGKLGLESAWITKK